MPSSLSSSIHLSHQSSRRSKKISASTVEEEPEPKPVETTNMRLQEEPKRVSNCSLAKKEEVIRYRECRKNHAANIGGYAVDGCGEFMAAGEERTSDALKCAACNCHRNFHKRVVEGESFCDCSSDSTTRK
ncbi:hypothetical protein NE237_008960 [Protea cynaroides]|uniref:ZF-HD dimerization-type domain-containing protein n=1 Tax=Protea cynaroides TaxID=273540 RepID=A0A9Q0R094_9MAGN|nr:hypothetical protein NE237_008960 [Protea cynaroides]